MTIITIIVGAFLLSLLVAIITDWFALKPLETEAIHITQADKKAATLVRLAFEYNVARSKRYRSLLGEQDGAPEDHIPTPEEILHKKQLVYKAADRFRQERSEHANEEAPEEKERKKRDEINRK